jgi:hypothetical protein
MNDMRPVITPKSSQTNADDLIGGARTIRITGVKIAPSGEQRVAISYDGDDGKPWMPCKSMCRVLVEAWGPDANQYVGRSCTLYKDPKVKWGGLEVGGIRVSHLSHIDRDMLLALTETRGKRTPFLVKVLQDAPKPTAKAKPPETSAPAVPEKVAAGAKKLMMSVAACATIDDMLTLLGSDESRKQLAYLKEKYPHVHVAVAEAIADSRRKLEGPGREPGDDTE